LYEQPNDDLDELADENGIDDDTPLLNGIRSLTLTLELGGEPITDSTDGADDPNANFTLDFGFVPPDVPSISKVVSYTPPQTPTLGTTVTYVITVPNLAISRNVISAFVSDTVDARLDVQVVEWTITGGSVVTSVVNPSNNVAITIPRIPAGEQAVITITAVLSDQLLAQDADIITNQASLTFTGATAITYSNVVTTEVGEPVLEISKGAESSNGSLLEVAGSDLLTYTIVLTNNGSSAAYSVLITDVVPDGMDVIALYGGNSTSIAAIRPLTWRIETIPDGEAAVVSYTARVNGAAVNEVLTNTVNVLYRSLTDTVPGNRPYTETSTNTITTGVPATEKFVTPASDADNPLRIGDVVTYTIVNTFPAGLVTYWPYQVDVLPAGMRYIPGTFQISGALTDANTAHYQGRADYTPSDYVVGNNPSGANPNIGIYAFNNSQRAIEWWLETITNTTDQPQRVVITLAAQFTGVDLDGNLVVVDPQTSTELLSNIEWLYWQITDTNGYTSSTELDFDDASSRVGRPVLQISKGSFPPSGSEVGAGDTISYTLTITNEGTTPAYEVIITDTLPAEVTLVEVTSTTNPANASVEVTQDGRQLTFVVSELAPDNATMSINVIARVTDSITAGLRFTNTAAITQYDTQPLTGTDRGLTPTQRVYTDGQDSVFHTTGQPDLDLTKAASPALVSAGGLITYTISVVNNGDATATGVVITDVVPISTTLVDTDPSPDNISGGVLSWNIGLLDAGQSVVVTMVVRADSAVVSGTIITNTALVTSNEGVTDTDTVTTPTEGNADVEIAKRNEPADVVLAGEVLTYTLLFTNNGPSDAADVIITDTLPAAVVYGGEVRVDAPFGTASVDGRTLAWTANGVLTAGVSGEIVLTVTVPSSASGQLVNSVVITTSTPGDSPPNNEDSVTNTVNSEADVEIAKRNEPADVVLAGEVLTYTLLFTNNGPSDAADVIITDTLPAAVVYGGEVRVDAPFGTASVDGRTLAWTANGVLTAGVSGEIVLTVTVPSSASGQLVNSVVITTSTPGDSPPNNEDSVTNTVNSEADVEIAKQNDPTGAVIAGEIMTYTLIYTNNGPSDAVDVYITDTLPASVTFKYGSNSDVPDIAGPSYDGSQLFWYIPVLTAGTGGTLRFTVTIESGASGELVNSVVITTSTPGDNPNNNDDTVTNTVDSEADVEIAKQNDPANIVVAGEVLTYTLLFTNNGPSDAADVAITDTLPASVAFGGVVSVDPPFGGSTVNGQTLVWTTSGVLTAGVGGAIVLTVTVNSGASGELVNSVGITTSTPGDNPPNNEDTVTNTVGSRADVTIAKLDQPDPVATGAVLTYVLVFANNGPSDAENVVITDTLPDEVTYNTEIGVDAPFGTVSVDGQTLVWQAGGVLTAGASGRITFTVNVADNTPTGVITNRVVITSTTPDDNRPNNNTDEPTTVLEPGIDVLKLVTVSPNVVSATVTYTLRITNSGDITFTSLLVTDTLPNGFEYVNGTSSLAGTDISGSQPLPDPAVAGDDLAWTINRSLRPGGVFDLNFEADIALASGITGTFINVFTATGIYTGGTVTDTDDVPVTVEDPAIVLTKTVVSTSPGVITFAIEIENVGPSTLDVVPLFDVFEGPITYARGFPEPNQIIPNTNGGRLTWFDLTDAAPNGFDNNLRRGGVFTVTVVFSITAPLYQYSFTNTAVASGTDIYNNNTVDRTDTVSRENTLTAIELLYFRGAPTATGVLLEWATASEINNFGFRLLRSKTGDLQDATLVAEVPGVGNSVDITEYDYIDTDVAIGTTYTYWLIDIEYDPVNDEFVETLHSPITVDWDGTVDDGGDIIIYLPTIMKDDE
jgi:uncharacterized repeat protein (TIGR01451 family)/fimbrial isopeptide formation D2 family protein